VQAQIEKSLQEFQLEKMKLQMQREQMRLDHAFRLQQLELQVAWVQWQAWIYARASAYCILQNVFGWLIWVGSQAEGWQIARKERLDAIVEQDSDASSPEPPGAGRFREKECCLLALFQ
jgi:hypothetical protein